MKTLLQTLFTTVTLASIIEAAEAPDPLKLVGSGSSQGATASQAIGHSINAFGLDLHQRLAEAGLNTVTSPWSIETALAMAYAGADGQTKAEMGKVLHLPIDEKFMHDGFASLAAGMQENAAGVFMANRIYGLQGKSFKQPFLDTLEKSYRAPLESLSFDKDPAGSRKKINDWVATQTKDRIQNLIPDGGITTDTQLVLCNAAYFKASWAKENHFDEMSDFEFAVLDHKKTKVTGLITMSELGYQKIPGGAAVTIPYENSAFQLVLLVPDDKEIKPQPPGALLTHMPLPNLEDMEKQLTPEVLEFLTKAERKLVMLQFPKFKLQPETVNLTDHLVKMGMPSAFNQQGKSADFSRMSDDDLLLSAVFHKAFITVDKNGTEAAAATAVTVSPASEPLENSQQPLKVIVNRPFAFAIQHINSGACLFLGRVTDPR